MNTGEINELEIPKHVLDAAEVALRASVLDPDDGCSIGAHHRPLAAVMRAAIQAWRTEPHIPSGQMPPLDQPPCGPYRVPSW